MIDFDTLSALGAQARTTGRAVPLPGGNGLVVYPNGTVGTLGGGFGGRNALMQPPTVAPAMANMTPGAGIVGQQGLPGTPSGPAVPAPQSWWDRLTAPNANAPNLGLNAGTPVATLPTITVTAQRPPTVLNQANPNVQTYAGQPQLGGVNIGGQTDTQSGPPVHATYDMPPAPDLATQARTYRAATARPQGGGMTTDQLNAMSLAAAQAGRTYWNPAANVQPGGNVLNALVAPPNSNQLVAAQ